MLQIHHIRKRSQLGGNELENLFQLCAKHHARAERRKISADELRAILTIYYGYQYENL